MTTVQLQHELIRASAGTGKTHQLTNRYLQLLRMGERPDEILASTFTRKAAGEILDRVLLRLAKAATFDKELQQLQRALGDSSLTSADCLSLLVVTIGQLHRLRIGTLDSFFARLAGSFALEIGLPPVWRIAEEYEDAVLRDRALQMLLDNENPSDLRTLVHALFRGKTTRSLRREVRETLDKLYEVYRQSDRNAWFRLPRHKQLTKEQLAEAIETLRSLSLPDHKQWKSAHAKDVQQAETEDWENFVKDGIAGKVASEAEEYGSVVIDASVRAAYQPLIDHARAVLINQLADQTEATWKLLDRFHTCYQQLKSQTRALRFDDITYQLAQLPLVPSGASSQAGDAMAFRLDGHLRHLLLDEFQDTSLAQWKVIQPLARKVTRAGSKGSFFCVGDTKQAIYGWRGGEAEIFNDVADQTPGIHERKLHASWRSAPPVIEAVNDIFQNLDRHNNLGDLEDAVKKWQAQFHEHKTERTELGGYVCLQAACAAGDGEKQDEVTLRFAAEQVVRWTEKAPGYNIGVLVRTNDAVRQLIFQLRQLGIEASEEGGSSLEDSAAVQLVLSLMQLADHPGDLVARYHVATSPLAEPLGLRESLGSQPVDDPIAAARRFAGNEGNAVARKLASKLRRRLIADGYGRTVYWLAQQLADSCNRRELRRMEKLLELAYQYDELASTRPGDFVRYVRAARVSDPVSARVRVMTIHQAKGLQFDIVVLTDLEKQLTGQADKLVVGRRSPTEPIDRVCRHCGKGQQQLLPGSWQQLFRDAQDRDVIESLCVLYVAVTRAVHALHMIVAPSRPSKSASYHKTYSGLLRASLAGKAALSPEEIAYETGDPQWYERPGVERQPSESEVAVQTESLEPLQVQLAPAAARRWRNLQRVTPSGLEGGTHVRLVEPSGSGVDAAAARARGTLIHAWFEQIQWLDDGPPSDQLLRQVAAELVELALSAGQVDQLVGQFRRMLGHREIAECLKRAAYSDFPGATLEVETERPFAVRDGDRLLVGTIDRLVTIWQGDRPIAADIIDYKTDAIAAGDPQALAEKTAFYRPQIDAYRCAVASMFGCPPERISCRLLFLDPGRIVTL